MGDEIKTAGDAIIAAGVLGGIIGSLLTVLLSHRLTVWRERRTGIKAEKLKIIPIIEGYLIGARKGETCTLAMIRNESRHRLFEPIMRFRVILTKKQMLKFDTIWDTFYNTTIEEVDNQPNISAEQNEQMKQKLVSRLESILKFISKS